MSFLSLNGDIKPWLGIDVLNTTHDATLTVINLAMEQAVLNYVETDFKLNIVVGEVLDGNISDVVFPINTPINSVEGLYFFPEADGSGGSLVDPEEYRVSTEAIYLKFTNSPKGRATVRVDYTWGYDGLPADVKLMMLQAIEAEWRRKGAKSLGIGGRSKKDESETYINDLGQWDEKSGLPKVLVAKLQSYKCFEFPSSPMAQRNW
jgi:hypothetical protein